MKKDLQDFNGYESGVNIQCHQMRHLKLTLAYDESIMSIDFSEN